MAVNPFSQDELRRQLLDETSGTPLIGTPEYVQALAQIQAANGAGFGMTPEAQSLTLKYSGPGPSRPVPAPAPASVPVAKSAAPPPAQDPDEAAMEAEFSANPPIPVQVPSAKPPPTPEAPDFDPASFAGRFAEARKRGDQTRLLADLGRAAAMINSAIGHTKYDPHEYDSLDAQASLPETQVEKDMSLAKLAAEARAKKEAGDPNSRANRSFREQLQSYMPAFAARLGPAYDSLTQAQLEKMLPIQTSQQKLDLQKKQIDATTGLHKATLESTQAERTANAGRKDREDTEKERHDKAMEDRMGLLTQATQSNIQGRADQQNLVKLANETSKHSELVQGLEQLEESTPGLVSKGVVPKDFALTTSEKALLALPGGVGTWMASPKALELQKRLASIRDLVTRARTGAVINANEEKQYQRQFSDQALANPEAVGPAVKDFAQLLWRRMKDKQLGFAGGPHPVLGQYESEGGTTYRNSPVFSGFNGAAQPPAPVPAAAAPQTRVVNGRTLVFENGQWFEVTP
jgi:hypothetical protein